MGSLILGFGALAFPQWAQAHVGSNINCISCHSSSPNHMDVVDYQKTLDVGQGPQKVYAVKAGDRVPIGINVTDGRNSYALNFNVQNPAGVTNSQHTLSFQPDSSWQTRNNGGIYYSLGPLGTAAKKIFNLTVNASTPPDVYRAEIITAGVASSRWGQRTNILIEVVGALPPPTPQVISPTMSGSTFSCSVSTTPGFNYSLDFKGSLSDTNWTTVNQTPGDGTSKVLSDPNASSPNGFYRVRAQ